MATALSMIKTALRRIGAHGAGQTLSAEDSADALEVLNTMIDSWQVQKLLIYHVLQRTTTWPANTSTRTVGSAGNYTFARPDTIESAYVTVDDDEYPLHVLRQRTDYDQIADKGATSKIPESIFYDNAYPTATLYMYGVPTEAIEIRLNVWDTLQSFAATSTTVSLPPGYQRAIEWSLAEELIAEYPSTTDPASEARVKRMAAEARRVIKTLNSPQSTLTPETGYMTSRLYGNILTGV